YAGIVDDSEVDHNRPIKCCDDIHSISHYPPAPAMRGEGTLRGVLAIREILTAAQGPRPVRSCESRGRRRARGGGSPRRGRQAGTGR
ncbi:hypothetical protein FH729_24870, partial [Bacteroides thetaiotaomicron]|nr:hypothetical protein [Bacteroides thetaiotaomicron]